MKTLPQALVAIALLAALPSVAQAAGLTKSESQKAGAALFRDKGCAYCHGINAQGTARGPSLATVRKRLKASQIVDQIENGGQKMPSFRDSLSHDEVMALVQFLRARHRPAPPPLQTPPESAPVVNPAQKPN